MTSDSLSQSEANEGPFEFKTEAAPSENTVSELSGNSLWILAFNYNVFIEKADLLFRQVFRRGVRVQLSKLVPSSHLMSEEEWRGLGVQQSQGWIHYMIHKPEPHILLFRRPLPKE
uniref:Cyclin-dependent kinases regulatory subunit n=1 Tax=Cyprinus carpio TaxID=7962 RepID=A0A8C2KFV7_CYPCA